MKKGNGVFRMQLRRLLTRRESKIAWALSAFFMTAAFTERCFAIWGFDQSMLFSAAFGWIGNIGATAANDSMMQAFYYFAISLIAALPFSGSFLEDRTSRSLTAILSHTTWKSYWKTGVVLSFVGGFCVIFVPLLVSQLLSFLLFVPTGGSLMGNLGGDGAWSFPTALTNDAYIFPSLTTNHPYLSNLVFILASSLFAGCNAAVSYLLSLFGVHKKLLVLGIPTLVWVVYNVTITFIDAGLVFQVYLYPDCSLFKDSWFFFVLPLSLLLVILAGCLAVQKRKKEAVLL